MKDELGRIVNKTAAYFNALLPNLPGRIQAISSSQQKPIISVHLTFRRRIKSRLPFAGIIRRLPYSTLFQDKG